MARQISEDDLAPKSVFVEQANKKDREIIVDSLTRSFWDDPMYAWLAKHDAYYGARFRRIFEAYWDHFALPYEQIHHRIAGSWVLLKSYLFYPTGWR